MIDIKKVREALKSRFTGYGDNEMLLCYTEEQRNMVKQALTELERLQKKEIPMKPIIKMGGMGNTWKIPYCPICDTNLQSSEKYMFKYCPRCGQKLDWSDE